MSWYHTIDLGNGIVTQGAYDHRPYLSYYGFPDSLAGKSALDVGPASGFFAFEFEKQGAQVTVVELPDWKSHDFGPLYVPDMDPELAQRYLHRPFCVAAEILRSHIRRCQMTIYELSAETLGKFDLVFCGSLLIHLSDPARALWRIQQVTKEAAIIATVIRPDAGCDPIASFVGHQRGDCWWVPNRAALELMVKSAGFRGWEWWSDFRLDYRDGAPGPYHGVIHAWNTAERPDWLPAPCQRSTPSVVQSLPVTPPIEDAASTSPESLDALRRERDAWRTLAEGYAKGRVMRLLNWVNRSLRAR